MTKSSSAPRFARTFRTLIVAGIAATIAVGGAAAGSAQDPGRSSISAVPVINADGLQIGFVTASDFDSAVTFTLTASTLEPGEHGVHIHETGVCDLAGDTVFGSAGGHFNPTGTMHGPGNATIVTLVSEPEEGAATPVAATSMEASPVADVESHAGDLGNVVVDDSGRVSVTITTSSVTLLPDGENSLADADGSALVIHAGADDLHTDPSGESGDRIACTVLFPPAGAAATPEA
ncbi:MAG TPA: superoxide dismutase family protein [Thermomicrobiales bacterium]|nr:superoxide dismutase family protein [Thermomicrobiales bacterium]